MMANSSERQPVFRIVAETVGLLLLILTASPSQGAKRRLAGSHVKSQAPCGCAECHIDIVRQWRASPHAEAWTDREFVTSSFDRSAAQCLPCHAPDPVLEQPDASTPVARDARRDHGVDCHACHAFGRAYAGPYGSRVGPHPVTAMPARIRSQSYCGSCHEVELAEYNSLYVASVSSGRPRRACIDCHMKPAFSRLTQGHILSLIHPKRVVRNHSFNTWTPSVTKGAVQVGAVSVRHESNGTFTARFTLTNRGAGHRIPTGRFGYRLVRIEAVMLAADGRVLGTDETSLLSSREDGLVPGKSTPFSLNVEVDHAGAPTRVRLLVERLNRDRSFRYTLATGEWPVSL